MQAIIYKGQKVITTELLAQAYETDIKIISNNFNRNKERFTEGKHYYLLTGQELKDFKANPLNDECLKFASSLYLWTERGANRHSKILDTDKAWEQFENLEETYFRVKSGGYAFVQQPNYELLKCLNGLANFLRVQISVAKAEGKSPAEISAIDEMYCHHLGVPSLKDGVPQDFAQLSLEEVIEKQMHDNERLS